MQTTKHFSMRKVSLLCAAVILIFSISTVCYAADVGGLRRTIQLWIHGDQTDAIMEIQDGQYQVTYEDQQGNLHQQSGGGIAIEPDGSERPVTEEEILDHLNNPEVEYKDDGTVWVYYRNQSLEITDRFDADGVCYVQLKNGDDILYLTVRYQDGYSTSTNAFVQP